ncbi:MAG TPA: tyrosine-type recombinase/integrase [Gemmatimonadales bacterium]
MIRRRMIRRAYARMYERPGRGWYGDFRNFAEVGGEREALRAEGSRRATSDQAQAALLFARRLEYLQARRVGRIPAPAAPVLVPTLSAYVDRHAELKAADGRARPLTLAREREKLNAIARWWGDPRLDAIDLRHFNELKLRLKGRAAQTVCHYLNAVSSVLQSAVSDGYVRHNVARDAKRPRVSRGEVPYLESAQGHALLVAAAALDADPDYRGVRPLQALIGTALLAGPRKRELFALLVEDVDFNAGVVRFRPNTYYGDRKSRHAVRKVPLWPQLRALLVPVVGDRARGLLFPATDGEPLRDVRGAIARAFGGAGLAKPRGKEWHLFRHTYTALRLQTLDSGAPVSLWTVARELGHGGVGMIEQTYGHLLEVRHRLAAVEYRPLQIAERVTRSA